MKPPRLHDKARWLAHLDEALVAGAKLEEAWDLAWASGTRQKKNRESLRRATGRSDVRIAQRLAACVALRHLSFDAALEVFCGCVESGTDSQRLWLALPQASRDAYVAQAAAFRRAAETALKAAQNAEL